MNVLQQVQKLWVDAGGQDINVDLSTAEIFKESIELAAINRKSRNVVIKELNKQFDQQMTENIEVRKDLP